MAVPMAQAEFKAFIDKWKPFFYATNQSKRTAVNKTDSSNPNNRRIDTKNSNNRSPQKTNRKKTKTIRKNSKPNHRNILKKTKKKTKKTWQTKQND